MTMFNFSFLPKYAFYFWQGIAYTLLLSVISVLLAILHRSDACGKEGRNDHSHGFLQHE